MAELDTIKQRFDAYRKQSEPSITISDEQAEWLLIFIDDFLKESEYDRLLLRQLLLNNQRLAENNLHLRDKIDKLATAQSMSL